jgi:hypothetical protein
MAQAPMKYYNSDMNVGVERYIENDNLRDEASDRLHSNNSCGKLQIIDSGTVGRVLAIITE